MFGVPVESVTKGSTLRQKGKIAELALGYGGSKGALISMGALNMGLTKEELPELVSAWRKSNSNIVKLWWDIERAAITAVKDKTVVTMQYGLKFYYKGGVLFIRLPSGRNLAYVRPRIEIDERFNKDKLTYEGIEGNKWGRISTYGGKLTENIIQAIARDCLAEALLRLDKAGYKIVFHVHDEVILDVPKDAGSLEEVEEIMGLPIPWAPGLPLEAEAFETDYYKKIRRMLIMNEMKVFNNTEFGELGVLVVEGREYFPATECARILGYKDKTSAIKQHCRWVVKHRVPHPQNPDKTLEMNFIPEGDLYRLIVKSKLPTAEKFEKWVFDEVLPSIRKHGMYVADKLLDDILKNPDLGIKIFTEYKEAKEKAKQLELENAQNKQIIGELQPKASYYDLILQNNSLWP